MAETKGIKLTKEEQVYFWLLEGAIDFTKIVSMYVAHLEKEEKDNRTQIADLSFIATMYREPKMNHGTKKDLELRYAKAIIKSGIFRDTQFEQQLEMLLLKEPNQ